MGLAELLIATVVAGMVCAVVLIPYWKIFTKLQFSGWLSLLMLVPLANVVVLYAVAFSSRPIAGGTCLKCGAPLGAASPFCSVCGAGRA